MLSPAPITMNSALTMLLNAMTRARVSWRVRCWTTAYMGTTYRPPKNPIRNRSSMAFQPPAPRNCAIPASGVTGLMVVSAKCAANAVSPRLPMGVRPISTRRPDSHSHTIEPTPIPMASVAISDVVTVSLALRTSLP